jgi:hypothetical protein
MKKPDPKSVERLVEDFSELLRAEPVDTSQRDWNQPYQAICERLKNDSLLDGLAVDEHVWHWLSDADIRARDSEYARLQNDGLVDILRRWRHPS